MHIAPPYNFGMERSIALKYNQNDDLDISVANSDLVLDATLSNRIVVSLFTWRAPDRDDVVPNGITPGGFWGDNVTSQESEVAGTFGSRLWLLDGKITDETIASAVAYARESLDWMNSDSSIADFDISATRAGANQLDLTVVVNMANGDVQRLVYADILNWGK